MNVRKIILSILAILSLGEPVNCFYDTVLYSVKMLVSPLLGKTHQNDELEEAFQENYENKSEALKNKACIIDIISPKEERKLRAELNFSIEKERAEIRRLKVDAEQIEKLQTLQDFYNQIEKIEQLNSLIFNSSRNTTTALVIGLAIGIGGSIANYRYLYQKYQELKQLIEQAKQKGLNNRQSKRIITQITKTGNALKDGYKITKNIILASAGIAAISHFANFNILKTVLPEKYNSVDLDEESCKEFIDQLDTIDSNILLETNKKIRGSKTENLEKLIEKYNLLPDSEDVSIEKNQYAVETLQGASYLENVSIQNPQFLMTLLNLIGTLKQFIS